MLHYVNYYPEIIRNDKGISAGTILNRISYITRISIMKMQSKSQNFDVSDARKAFCCVARFDTKTNLKHIGNMINRDHATVLYNIGMYYLPEATQIIKKYYGNMDYPKLKQKYYDLIKHDNRLKDAYVEALPKQNRLTVEAMAHVKHPVFTEPEYRHILTDYLTAQGETIPFEDLFKNHKAIINDHTNNN